MYHTHAQINSEWTTKHQNCAGKILLVQGNKLCQLDFAKW